MRACDQSVMIHEVGRVLGIGHGHDAGAMMYPVNFFVSSTIVRFGLPIAAAMVALLPLTTAVCSRKR